jgi:DNA invertase Pin-like site-specific DNA recombinase
MTTRYVALPFIPRAWQIPLIDDPAKRIVAVVHRRAGKSTGLMWRGIKRALTIQRAHPPPRVVHTLPVQVQWARTGMWDALALQLWRTCESRRLRHWSSVLHRPDNAWFQCFLSIILRMFYTNAAEARAEHRDLTVRKLAAVAYYRTSSANVGPDKDSERRQRDAVAAYAKTAKLALAAEFYDTAVSGADPVDRRAGFVALLAYCAAHDVAVVLVETASRFARDLAVQLTGHAVLRARDIELIPVDAPSHFTDPTPTAEMVRQILGAVSQFEKASLVAKLRHARERVKATTGRCEGRRPVPAAVVAEAWRLDGRTPDRPEAVTARDRCRAGEA